MSERRPYQWCACGRTVCLDRSFDPPRWVNESDGSLHTCNVVTMRGETMQRDRESIKHEVEYWSAAIDEVKAITDGIRGVAETLTRIPATSMLMMIGGEDPIEYATRVSGITLAALKQLRTMQLSIDAISELFKGRALALRREAGLVDDGETS